MGKWTSISPKHLPATASLNITYTDSSGKTTLAVLTGEKSKEQNKRFLLYKMASRQWSPKDLARKLAGRHHSGGPPA